MKMSKLAIINLAALLTFCPVSYADNGLKQKMVRNSTVPAGGYVPKDGFVPDAKTASAVGIAVLTPIYGVAVIDAQKPFQVSLVGDIWVVSGRLPKGAVGGVAEIDISKKNGKVLRVIHGM